MDFSDAYIISDTHFGHRNIIKYCNRPFKNEDIMDERLVKNWNSVVSESGKVVHLGDFAYPWKEKDSDELITSYRKALNGNIFFLLGNHDKQIRKISFWKGLFNTVRTKPMVIHKHFILSHEPVEILPDGMFNICGHIHEKTIDDPRYFNVSAEQIGYKPIKLSKVMEELEKRNKDVHLTLAQKNKTLAYIRSVT
jgi:calcineurin-like phosphoesterase family protein